MAKKNIKTTVSVNQLLVNDFENFLAWVDELIFDPEFVNEELSAISDKWEDFD